MRPKTRVLLVDSDETRISTQRFLLETRGYRVFASDGEGVLDDVQREAINVVLVVCEMKRVDAVSLVARLRHADVDKPVMLLSETMESLECPHLADYFLGSKSTASQLIEQLRVFANREKYSNKRKPAQSVRPLHLEAASV